MTHPLFDAVLKRECHDWATAYNAHISTDIQEVRGFLGESIITAVITFTLTGIAGAIVSEAGKSLWSSLKKLCKKIFQKQGSHDDFQVVIKYPVVIEGKQGCFVCLLRKKNYQEYLEGFAENLPTQVKKFVEAQALPNKEKSGGVVYEFLKPDRWKESIE
jgi:hypothetical protein